MLQIGDLVTYDGRVHRLVGITPMSVRPFAMQLEDPETGETFWVDAEPRQEGGELHVVLKDEAARAARERRRD